MRVFEAKKEDYYYYTVIFTELVPYTRILHAFYIKNFVIDCMLISKLYYHSYEQMNVITILLQIVLSIYKYKYRTHQPSNRKKPS